MFASRTGLTSGTILKIEFRNVVGELEVVLNREFQVFVGVPLSSQRVLQVLCAAERLQRVVAHFIMG